MNCNARATIGHYLMLRAVSAFAMALIGATYATFLIARGMNLFEVNVVNFMFYATLFIFEIPTGAFADVFGRKFSFVLSCGLYSAGMFIYGYATSFWGFVAAEMTAAVGATFASGAFQAWLVDRLKQQGHEESLTLIFAREQQIKSTMSVTAGMTGAYLAQQNLALPWLTGGGVMALAGILAIVYMQEVQLGAPKQMSCIEGFRAMRATIVTSARYAHNSSAIRFLLLIGVAQSFAVQAANMQWQPFFGQFLPDTTSYGFLFAAFAVAFMVGAALAPRLVRRITNERLAISVTQLVVGAGIALTVLCRSFAPALVVFLVHEIARGTFGPLSDKYLNDNVPSEQRATLLSFESISYHFGGMIGLLASGVVAQYGSIQAAWIMSGTILVMTALALIRNRKT